MTERPPVDETFARGRWALRPRLADGKIVERWGVVDAAGVVEQLVS